MENHKFRRLFRFGVRTLLFLVLVIGIYLGIWTNKANRQRRALHVIGETGSFVFYHEHPFRGRMKPGEIRRTDYLAKPPGPVWLRSIIGDDYFQTVRMVHFSPTDESMTYLRCIPNVDDVAIDAYQLTSEGFQHLSCLRDLDNLRIHNGHNLGNSMATLAKLPKIRRLLIFNTPIDHRSVEYLGKLDKLEQLYLSATLLTDNDVARLRTLLPDASITVDQGDPETPVYQPPSGQPKRTMFLPYNKHRGTSKDRRMPK